MSQQDHDKITEEQDAPKLIADFRALYKKTNAANAQSLARIRSRLQSQTTAQHTERAPIPMPQISTISSTKETHQKEDGIEQTRNPSPECHVCANKRKQ